MVARTAGGAARVWSGSRRSRWPVWSIRPSTRGEPVSENGSARGEGLLVVGCSRRKVVTSVPVPALELYQGWCFPRLRERLAGVAAAESRVLILSARHGLIGARTPIATYDQSMTPARARELRAGCGEVLTRQVRAYPSTGALLLVEPLYLEALGPVPTAESRCVGDPSGQWDVVEDVLTGWGWR
ncbi:DUF6884 domain-containing protein [Nocardia takedensis]|uniref:DUF6884 domain-containing protein n=1 Tax=Nocardia takedensis TaxID=259390 RepID=UPI003F760522